MPVYARAVDDAAAELRELRCDEWEDLGLAGLALVLAVGAAELYPPLALPLFLAGVVIGARGVRALWRRWDLVDRLAGEPDAYVISEVFAYALRETAMERRRTFAALIRFRLSEPVEARVQDVAGELMLLAAELEDADLTLEPASAVTCSRLLGDVTGSALFNPGMSPEELRSRIHQIRCGFRSRRRAD